ncbi:hypothetical protein PsYK624_110560 [Phanerochaete sordida]|uniref:Uncharacterized protein n=1 Tax=Phanerochaete sordida TaxID=48140 RepID=A0A9P3GH40_9APHY|nr:hypothetical protein PsYK624_110560 [Phanerochaete sordida]
MTGPLQEIRRPKAAEAAKPSSTSTVKKKTCTASQNKDQDVPAKKPHTAKKKAETPEPIGEDVGIIIVTYIEVTVPSSAPQVQSRTGKKPAKVAPTPAAAVYKCGPIEFDVEDTFEMFFRDLADAVHCTRDSLPVPKLMWKLANIKSSPEKPITNAIGFKAMLTAVQEKRRGDRQITVMMPRPDQRPQTFPWEVGTEDERGHNRMQEFYNTEAQTAAEDPFDFHSQKQRIDDASQDCKQQICNKYPVGNLGEPYQDIRVYRNAEGRMWELNDLRISVWANKLARGKCTVDAPPNAPHFGHRQSLKPRTAPSSSPVALPPTAAGSSSFPEAFLAATMQQQQRDTVLAGGFGFNSVPGTHATHLRPPSVTQSFFNPDDVPAFFDVPNTITLSAWCARYRIPVEDEQKISHMGFVLGDRDFEDMPESVWKDEFGFAYLAWDCIKRRHIQFYYDLKDGKWDKPLA